MTAPSCFRWQAINRDSLGARDKEGVVRFNSRWSGSRPEICSFLRASRAKASLTLITAFHRQRVREAFGLLAHSVVRKGDEAVLGPTQNGLVPMFHLSVERHPDALFFDSTTISKKEGAALIGS